MTYKLTFIENKLGIKIETEKKTFSKLIDFIKEYLLDNGYEIATCTINIVRIDRYGTVTTLADGSGGELLDLVRVADFGLS